MSTNPILNYQDENIKTFNSIALDDDISLESHKKYRIKGEDCDPVSLYDLPKYIAIDGEGAFVGSAVKFI